MPAYFFAEGSVIDLAVRVLLVEDDIELGRAVARRLSRDGLQVVVTPSCATTHALTCCCEIGIFDVELVDGDGIDLARSLLADGRIDHAVFFTGCAFQAAMVRATRIGPVVAKRDGVDALLPVLDGLLGRRAPKQSMVLPTERRRPAARRRTKRAG
jgi:DNA-binding response OmpR family regulator